MSAFDEIKFWYVYNSHVSTRYLRAIRSLPRVEALKDRGKYIKKYTWLTKDASFARRGLEKEDEEKERTQH